MKKPALLAVILAILALPTLASAATAPSFTSLTTTVSGRTVSVAGVAAFGSEDPVLFGEDGSNDNTGGANTANLGLDIRGTYISQPSASQSSLKFTLDLAGLTNGGIPELLQYNWDIAVNGGSAGGGSNWSIKTMRSSAFQTAGQDPWAAVNTCVPSANGFTCSVTSVIPVTYDASTGDINMTVPLNAISAKPGDRIEGWARNGEPVWVRPSASGAQTPGVSIDQHTPDGVYEIPTRTVQLGLAPAGTPESGVTFGTTATVKTNSSFTGSITAPAAGSYDLWAKACFAGSCTVSSTPVSVA